MGSTPPPSALTLSAASLIFGLVAGYFVGSGSSIGLFGTSTTSSSSKRSGKKSSAQSRSWPNSYDVTVQQGDSSDEEFARAIHTGANDDASSSADESNDDDEEEEEAPLDTTQLQNFANTNEEVKLMLVVRSDLGMTKGKIAAQCGHATLAVYKSLAERSSGPGRMVLNRWEAHGQPKIALKCDGGEDELLMLQATAISLGLVARVIRDAGRTQIAAGSATVLGLLGPKSVVDQVTGGLKLL
jgi:peptidyl-tRNA hydrolase, PTH2 family